MLNYKDFDYSSLEKIGFFEKHYESWTKKILKKPATLVLYRSGDTRWVWAWTFTLGKVVFWGRTLSQLRKFSDILERRLNGGKILTFVPRLSEDIVYLQQYLNIEDHQIMSDTRGSSDCYQARHSVFTLECAEKLTGYYIDELIEDWEDFSDQVIHQDDDFAPFIDQLWKRATRFQDCIEEFMKAFGVTPETCPKTLAGFAKDALRRAGWLVKNRDIMAINDFSRETATEMIFPDYDLAKKIHRLRRGGDTLPSKAFVGKLIKAPVFSDDFKSEYPCVLVDEKYPCGRFERLNDPTDKQIISLLKGDHAFFGKFIFKNLRTDSNFPYLDTVRDRAVLSGNATLYCSRIVNAETAVLWLTERDFRVLLKEYQFDSYGICELYYQKKEYLPEPITALICYLFDQKEDDSNDYSVHKIVLNAISGIMGIDLLRKDISEKAYYQKLKDALVPPQIYVWMCAYGRYALREMLWEAGDKAVYAAVDCVKHLQPMTFECAKKWEERSKKRGAVTKDGKKWLGMIHTEWVASKFIAVGQACYAYEEISDEPVYDLTPKELSWALKHNLVPKENTQDYIDKQRVQITISGVPSQIGGLELCSHEEGIEAFKEDFEFHCLPRRKSKIVHQAMGRTFVDGHWVENSDYIRTTWSKNWLIGAGIANEIEDIFDVISLKEYLFEDEE